jgi:Tol biopolymer transport system component
MQGSCYAIVCLTLAALSCAVTKTRGEGQEGPGAALTRDPGLAARFPLCFSHNRFNISTMIGGKLHVLTSSNRDFKPVSSPDGKTLVFFRVRSYGDGSFETWRTAIHVVTPVSGGVGKYERVRMPTNHYVHKLCISPSETKITYMFDNDNNGATYNDVQIAWAKFDAKSLRVWDQKLITPDDRATIDEYPKWSPDETMVLYDSDKAAPGKGVMQIYAYRIADGVERIMSLDPTRNDQFACILGFPH